MSYYESWAAPDNAKVGKVNALFLIGLVSVLVCQPTGSPPTLGAKAVIEESISCYSALVKSISISNFSVNIKGQFAFTQIKGFGGCEWPIHLSGLINNTTGRNMHFTDVFARPPRKRKTVGPKGIFSNGHIPGPSHIIGGCLPRVLCLYCNGRRTFRGVVGGWLLNIVNVYYLWKNISPELSLGGISDSRELKPSHYHQADSKDSKNSSKDRSRIFKDSSPILVASLALACFVLSFVLQGMAWDKVLDWQGGKLSSGIGRLLIAYALIILGLMTIIDEGRFLGLLLISLGLI